MPELKPRLRFDPFVFYGLYLVWRFSQRLPKRDFALVGIGLGIINQHMFRDFTFSIPRKFIVGGATIGVVRGIMLNDCTVYGPMLYSLLSKFCPHTFQMDEQILVAAITIALSLAIANQNERFGRRFIRQSSSG